MEATSTQKPRPGGSEVHLAALAIGVTIVAMALFYLITRLAPSGMNPYIPLVAALGVVGGTVGALLRPRWVFFGFVIACMVVPLVLEEVHIPLGFMKLYVQDLVFLFNVGLILFRMSVGEFPRHNIPFNRSMWLYFAVGIWGLLIGFVVSRNEFDNLFGDFRRAFFYMMNYFVAIWLCDGAADARKLRISLVIGGILIALHGLVQLMTGQFYYRRIGDAAHILSHFELTFLSFVIFYALAKLIFHPGHQRLVWFLVAAAGIIVTIVGNYRAAWLSLIGGLMFMFFYLPARKKVFLLGMSIASAIFLVLAISIMWDVQIEGETTLGEEILMKADVKGATSDVNVIWRFQSYENALNLWKEKPLTGTGLGVELEFSASTSTGGAMLARGHRVHNSFLWLLMSLGIFGFGVILYIFARYLMTIVRYLRLKSSAEARVTVMACGAFFVSFMISTSFEIFLESAMPITVLATSMALAMLMIRYGDVPMDGECGNSSLS